MAIRSHKVRRRDAEEEAEEVQPRRRRKMTLDQLEKKVQRRRVSQGVGGVTGFLKRLNQGLNTMNQEMAKQANKMPSDRDINRHIWG